MRRNAEISVLLPVFNGARFLETAIKSILSQCGITFEVIAIDDGSTDNTSQILKDFSRRDSRIRIVTRENRGLVATLNEALALSNGPLIARMDSDDIMVPGRLVAQKEYLDRNPKCLVVGSAIQFIDAAGKKTAVARYPRGEEFRDRMYTEGSMIAHPSVMMRREPVVKVGGYRAAFAHAEDYDLWLRLMDFGEIDNLPEVLLLYRQHAEQVSARHAVAQARSTATAKEFARVRQFGPEPVWNDDRPLDAQSVDKLPLADDARLRIHEHSIRAFSSPNVFQTRDWSSELAIHVRETGPAGVGLLPLLMSLVARAYANDEKRAATSLLIVIMRRWPVQAGALALRRAAAHLPSLPFRKRKS